MVAAIQPGIARSADRIQVTWASGARSELPFLWLRDNCDCDACRVAQTGEKRFMVSSVPVDIAPDDSALDGDTLIVTWPDGHVSRYRGDDIARLSAARIPDWQPWQPAFAPLRSDFAALLADDSVAAATLERLLVDGAIVLTNAGAAPGTLERLAPRLGPVREVLFARIHDVKVDPAGYNVAHTSLEVPPHNDFASYSWPPSVQALHMLVNDASGGESIIVDAFDAIGRLRAERPDDFDLLASVPVAFREFDAGVETYAVEPILRCDTAGRLTGVRFSNQLMQPPDPSRAEVGRFYTAYHELCRRLTAPDVGRSFRLGGGDVLVVAAHRVLHARRAFEPDGPRHLQDAYFELDNVANHYVLLRGSGT